MLESRRSSTPIDNVKQAMKEYFDQAECKCSDLGETLDCLNNLKVKVGDRVT